MNTESPSRSVLDASAARRAVQLALPMLTASLDDVGVGESGCMHVVVMDPGSPYGTCDFEAAILYEHSLPARDRWDADYAYYARGKAKLAWRTGLDTSLLVSHAPHLLRHGDMRLGGGIVEHGIVVAASGANPWFDDAFARSVACLLRAVAHERLSAATTSDSTQSPQEAGNAGT